MRGSKLHRLLTLRFIPEGCVVPRVLIHLLSLIFRRQGSWFQSWTITMTLMSAWECATPMKCSATGDSLVLLCMRNVVSLTINSTVEFLFCIAYVLLATRIVGLWNKKITFIHLTPMGLSKAVGLHSHDVSYGVPQDSI